MNRHSPAPLLALVLASLACRPVFVVGWQEILLVLLLAVFLLGPPVYRLLRAWIQFQESRKRKL